MRRRYRSRSVNPAERGVPTHNAPIVRVAFPAVVIIKKRKRTPEVMVIVKRPVDPGRREERAGHPDPARLLVPHPEAEMIRHPTPGLGGNPIELAIVVGPVAIEIGLPG